MEPEVIGNRIKKLIEIEQIEIKELAKKLNITESELIKKLDGEEEFYISQIIEIKEIFHLNLDVFAGIFFEPDFSLEENFQTHID